MSILRKIVVDVEVNTKESISALNKLSQATKSYREDSKIFKDFSKEQGKSIGLYKQQMDMVDSYKKKVQELKKAKEEELKAYEAGIKKTYGKDRTELTIGDVESKELANYAKELDNITKKTADYTKELGKTEKGSKEYQQTVAKMNTLDEDRTDIIKRSQIEADIAYNSMQSNLRAYEVDIDRHDSELGKLGRTYDNLRNSSDAFSDSIRRQGDALKGANATQYNKELQAIEKQHDQSMQTRRDSYNSIFNTADRVGTGLVAATSMSGAAAVGGKMAVDKYLDHNYNELDVMRMARGNDEQNAQLKESLDKTLRGNHESNEDIFALYHELIKHVDPSEYGQVLQDMAQNVLNISLAGDISTAEAADQVVKINKITEREVGDVSLFHGANELQNQFGVDLGNILTIINTSASRLTNAGWEDEDMMAIVGMTERLWARGNESAARGVAELGEMVAKSSYDTSEFERLKAYGQQTLGKDFNTEDLLDFMNGYENNFISALETALAGDDSVSIDLKKAKAEAESYQLKMDIMDSYGLQTTAELNNLLATTSKGDIFIQLLKGLEKLTGPQVMSDGTIREVTMAEIAESRGYLSNNSITQEVLNNMFKSIDQYGAYKEAVTTGMAEGTSLTDEANIFRESDKAQVELLKKELAFLIIDIGESLTPALLNLLENLDPVKEFILGIVDWIAELDPATIETALKGMLGLNAVGWGLKTVGFAGQTAFQISELGDMIGNVTGKNSKRSITKARDVAREEAGLVRDLVDAMISDDVSKGVTPLSIEDSTNIARQYVKVKGDEVKITKEAAELIGKQKDSMSKLVDVVDSVDDVGDVVSDASSTIRKTATDTAGIVSNLDDVVTKNTVGIGDKFKTFLSSLSPLTKVALAVGAIAATSYAIYKINDYLETKADEDRSWGKNSTVDEETRAKYEGATAETKRLRYDLRQKSVTGEGTTLSTEELSGLSSYMDELTKLTEGQTDKWGKWLDDSVMGKYAQEAVDKLGENYTLMDRYKEILEDIKENNGVASDAQIAELVKIEETLAKNLDESEGAGGSIEGHIANNQLLATMTKEERKEVVKTNVKELQRLEQQKKDAIQEVDIMRQQSYNREGPSMSDTEYQVAVEKAIKEAEDEIIPLLYETAYIAGNTNAFLFKERSVLGSLESQYINTNPENMAYLNAIGQTEGDHVFGTLQKALEVIGNINLPDGDSKNTKIGLYGSILGLQDNKDFLKTVNESRVAIEAFSKAVDEVGTKNFFDALPDLLANEEFKAVWDNMYVGLESYIRGLEDLDELTDVERYLYISSNLDEAELEIMDAKNLWENTEFTELLLGVMLKPGGLEHAISIVHDAVAYNSQTIEIDADTSKAQQKVDSLLNKLSPLRTMSTQGVGGYFADNKIAGRTSPFIRGYALGTNYHPGGMAILGDGFEPELVYEPGKAPYLSEMVPTKYNLSRGTVVIPYSKIPEVKNVNPPLYNEGVGSMSSVTGDTYNHEITVNAYTDNVDVELIKREMTKFIRDEELNKRRIKVSGGES